jgi:hypothetical protein
MTAPRLPERGRQCVNLVLALAAPLTTWLAFYTGPSFEEVTATAAGEPPIVPAGYAFVIWAFIYAGAVAYGVFQALPAQRTNPLFRRIGLFTATALLATSAWLALARFGQTWGTVACMVMIAGSLAVVFRELIRHPGPFTPWERRLVVVPFSVFTGWVSVALFANTAAALRVAGLHNVGLPEETWTVLMLLTAGGLGAGVTFASRGNVAYALTLVWALTAIVVANVEREPRPAVAAVAGAMAALIAGTLLVARALPLPAGAVCQTLHVTGD